MNKPKGFPDLPENWHYSESSCWKDVVHIVNFNTGMAFSVHLKRRTVATGFTIPYSIYPRNITLRPPTGRGWQHELIKQGFELIEENHHESHD